MARTSATGRQDRPQFKPKSATARLATGLLLFLTGVLLLFAAGTFIEAVAFLAYLASAATVLDTFDVLSILTALLSLTAIAGAGFALFRRELILALAFAAVALPVPIVAHGSLCDTGAECRLVGWAALPSRAFSWSLRIRPVTDPDEAKHLASAALSKAGSSDAPFRAKRFGDHWIVSAIDDDGWQGAHAVRIDTRTARATLIACPPEHGHCGMERPTVSDGRQLFRNDRVGLAAIFPASRPVCTARASDDEPRGFFTVVRAPDIPCEITDESRRMGVEVARSRKNGCAAIDAPSLPWGPLSPATAKLFMHGTPRLLDGRPSTACELHWRGYIQVSVYAAAASRPATPYEAYIVTTPEHLAEDVRSFDIFLKSVSIGHAP
jgi:hypothetical protein